MSENDASPVTEKSGQLATGYVAEQLAVEDEFPELVPEHGSSWMEELESADHQKWLNV